MRGACRVSARFRHLHALNEFYINQDGFLSVFFYGIIYDIKLKRMIHDIKSKRKMARLKSAETDIGKYRKKRVC